MEPCAVVVVGGANTDYLVKGGQLPAPGETVQGELFLEAAGGKGANQAVAVARWGARVGLVCRLGADARGDALRTALDVEGVDVRHVYLDTEHATGVALICVDHTGEKQIITAPGANLQLTESDVDAAKATIVQAKVVVAQLEVPRGAVELALRLAKAAGAKTVLDPAPAVPLPEELLRLVDVIRPNSSEAEVLTNVKVQDPESAARAARVLLARGVGAALVQAGAAGDLLVTDEGEWLFSRFPVESVDATGAGDAFVAAVAVALAEGRALPHAAELGSAAAALATTQLGAWAGLPRRAQVSNLLDAHRRPIGDGRGSWRRH
jgi:ribokinase